MVSLRFYIVDGEGLKRLSFKVMNRREPLPQFANRRMKAIETHYEREGGDVRFEALGHYIHFDKDGIFYVSDEQMANTAEHMWIDGQIAQEQLETPGVTNIDLHRRVKRLKGERWTPSEAEKAAIAADLLGAARPTGTSSIPLASPRRASPRKASSGQKLYLVYCEVFHPEEDEPAPQHRHFELLLRAASPDEAQAKCKAHFATLPREGELAFRLGTEFFADEAIEISDVPDNGAVLRYVRYDGELSAVGAILPFGGRGLAAYSFGGDQDVQPARNPEPWFANVRPTSRKPTGGKGRE
jgi:hypothetical protein